jgi:hypothetical protein
MNEPFAVMASNAFAGMNTALLTEPAENMKMLPTRSIKRSATPQAVDRFLQACRGQKVAVFGVAVDKFVFEAG